MNLHTSIFITILFSITSVQARSFSDFSAGSSHSGCDGCRGGGTTWVRKEEAPQTPIFENNNKEQAPETVSQPAPLEIPEKKETDETFKNILTRIKHGAIATATSYGSLVALKACAPQLITQKTNLPFALFQAFLIGGLQDPKTPHGSQLAALLGLACTSINAFSTKINLIIAGSLWGYCIGSAIGNALAIQKNKQLPALQKK